MNPKQFAKTLMVALGYGYTPVTRIKGNPISSIRARRNKVTGRLFFTFKYEQEMFGKDVSQYAYLQLEYDEADDEYIFKALIVTKEEYITWFPRFVQLLTPGMKFDAVKFLKFFESRELE